MIVALCVPEPSSRMCGSNPPYSCFSYSVGRTLSPSIALVLSSLTALSWGDSISPSSYEALILVSTGSRGSCSLMEGNTRNADRIPTRTDAKKDDTPIDSMSISLTSLMVYMTGVFWYTMQASASDVLSTSISFVDTLCLISSRTSQKR